MTDSKAPIVIPSLLWGHDIGRDLFKVPYHNSIGAAAAKKRCLRIKEACGSGASVDVAIRRTNKYDIVKAASQ